jgi:hypothetical protein
MRLKLSLVEIEEARWKLPRTLRVLTLDAPIFDVV